MADAFCVDDNVMLLALFPGINDVVNDGLLIIIIFFRNQHILRAGGNTAPQSDIAGIAAHNLDYAHALMGRGSIPYLIDCLHGRIDSCVKTDGIFRTGNIQIDGTRHTDRIYAVLGQLLRTGKGTVSAYDHQTVYSKLFAGGGSLFHTFFRVHLHASRGIQDRASLSDDIRHISGSHVEDFLIDKAFIPFQYAFGLQPFPERSAHRGPDSRVHTRCIASAGQDTNRLHLVLRSHMYVSFFITVIAIPIIMLIIILKHFPVLFNALFHDTHIVRADQISQSFRKLRTPGQIYACRKFFHRLLFSQIDNQPVPAALLCQQFLHGSGFGFILLPVPELKPQLRPGF